MPENNEIIIDFRKILRIIKYRKKFVIYPLATILLLSIVLTLFMPKMYESEVKILINKTNSTNISEANPFILSETGKLSNSGLSGLINGNNNLTDEIEIIKSPSVLDYVIKKNQLKHKYGKKKGRLLSTRDFIKRNFIVSDIKGSSVISIKYNSKNPDQTYKVLNDILSSYKKVYNDINRKKSVNDNELINNSYIKTKKELDNKIFQLKKVKSSTLDNSSGINFSNIAILGFYDKRIKNNLSQSSLNSVNSQKLEQEIEILTDKLKFISEKLEWSSTISKISDNASKITVIKNAEKPELIEALNLFTINNCFYLILLYILTSGTLIINKELTDKSVTLSDIQENANLIESKNIADNISIQSFLATTNTENLKIISLANDENNNSFIRSLNNINILKSDFTNYKNTLKDHISNIENKKIIILTQLGFSDRKTYKEIKKILNNFEIKNIFEFVFIFS